MRETTVADGSCDEHVAKDVGLGKAIEEMIPSGEGDKLFWAHWMDVLGYSLNAFRFSNLSFVDGR
ncbi:hypothetical protein IGI04_017522 [Brassica rapa subsp. trilocularis]|uniref:Uncharacterized protein n=1 Tax=Brassica rapa subsp. trilocularis TaxID=1813537 RepID=A0ABQ7MA95_BRACM|nr:hypothetical protein IGI04_017519 [Brassica rapa subsp. trilocularis]KAG5395707.1 hypothetical protein IGI04_017521 [Brassica rapa subsp. trilocularis]KAG5395708.1 hypothetical protein IGI04_017522 [Brassica rapa subsp. trilocularis]